MPQVILLGDSAVGKSKLVERYLMDEYNPRQLSTFALTLFRKNARLEDGTKVKVGERWRNSPHTTQVQYVQALSFGALDDWRLSRVHDTRLSTAFCYIITGCGSAGAPCNLVYSILLIKIVRNHPPI